MPECTPFEHFARDLFLHSTRFETDEIRNVNRDAVPILTDASIVLNIFADAHCELFLQSFAKTEKQVLQTDEQFFRFAIPRCLNLIDKDRYFFSIMLVASFLHELVHILRRARVCYRFHFTAYKCLAALFERAFKKSFEANGGWNGFGKYLNDVIDAFDATEEKFIMTVLNDGDDFLCGMVQRLIKRCGDVADNFNLNEYEISLLLDDDVKDMERSLKSDEDDEDPLNMPWPTEDEMIVESLKEMTLTESPNYARKDSDSYSPMSDTKTGKDTMDFEENDHSYYFIVDSASELEADAEMLLGKVEFLEKMKWRPCPWCGIKCYQFSKKLSSKQIDLALTNKFWGSALG